MVYNLLTEARIQGSLADEKPSERGYSTFWLENGNLEDWTTFIGLDIVGAWNGFLFGTKRTVSGGFIQPTGGFTPIDALVNDRIFFRMKYDKHPKNTAPTSFGKIRWTTTSDPTFDDDKSVTFELTADGKWVFYEVNMGGVSTWVGFINNIQFFPCEDGARNDEFFLNFFEIGTNDFTFSFDNEKAGSVGKATAGLPLLGEVTIEKDINDKLIVNIDNYGDVRITLTPQTATPSIIARDISLQLGKIAIGGYLRAQAFIDIDTDKMIIESGIRASDSSIRVKFGAQSAAPTLGFTTAIGEDLSVTEDGESPAPDFRPLSSYRPTTLELLSLFDNDDDLPALTLDPLKRVLEGGRADFDTVNQDLKSTVVTEVGTLLQDVKIELRSQFGFVGTTVIDIAHPFTDDGLVDKIFANGTFDLDGASKWKIFRPSLDGTLTLIDEGSIGKKTIVDAPSGGLVTSPIQDVVAADVSGQNVRVRAGDFLGVFNASLNAGQTGTRKIDALYYEISGDATGTITPPAPSGAGEAGLAIYAVGGGQKVRSVIDIDLGRRLNIDKIRVAGDEDTRDLEYNVAIASSSSFSADTPGDHIICRFITPTVRDCFARTNAAFNLQALNDGQVLAENGIIGFGDGGAGGLGGATVDGSTYFYVNGDAEFLDVFEFVGADPIAFDFARDPVGIDCFFSSSTPRLDKPIGKAVMYFKEKRNQRVFQIETAVGNKGGNGSKAGFSLVPADTMISVKIDEKEILPLGGSFVTSKSSSNLSDIFLTNPIQLDVVAGDGTVNPIQGIDFKDNVGELGGTNFRQQTTFIDMQWNRFEWNFDTIRTSGFRWYCPFHFSTKITEFEVYGVSESNETLGDNVQFLFSADGETFVTAALLEANEKEAIYKFGNSPQFIRMIIRPTLTTSVSDVRVDFEQDQVCFGEEGRLLGNLPINDSRIGQVGVANVVAVANNTGQQADLLVDISPDVETTNQLLYFSKLHSEEDIRVPQVGPPGTVDLDEDKLLKETENLAINAHAYGLISLASGTEAIFSENLVGNGDFETGDLTGWTLATTASGSETFQKPRVFDSSEGALFQSTLPDFQTGDFVFGFEIDNQIPITADLYVPMAFILERVIDVTDFVSDIDTGLANTNLNLDYRAYLEPIETNPVVRILGAPTTSGVNLSPGTTIPGYGNNLLRSTVLPQPSDPIATEASSDLSDFQAVIASGTRFLKLQFEIDATSERFLGATKRMKFLLDEVDFRIKLPETAGAKWYKSWRNSTGSAQEFEGFTDASFVAIKANDFVTTTGSTHWYQPFDRTATAGTPIVGQLQGFSNAFLQDRTKGIQSFSRMTPTNPGILGAQWEGMREIAGLRIAFAHRVGISAATAAQYPRRFQIEVLKTKAELGGVGPDLNNPAHGKVVRAYAAQGPFDQPSSLTADSSFDAPNSAVTTWLFEDGPVSTEGIKMMFTRNCDLFEMQAFDFDSSGSVTGAEFTAFNSVSTCPANLGASAFDSNLGIGVSFFVPLESRDITSLPIDNAKEHNEGNSTIFVAVDLGRVYDIDTSSDLFELVATTVSQSEWIATTSVYSATDTDDPNQVVWGGSSSNARWIRFSCPAVNEFEPEDQLVDAANAASSFGRVSSIPQSTLLLARIYPRIQTNLFPTIGYNTNWKDLGTILTDGRNDTFIFYSDFPVIALDLRRKYLLNADSTVFRNNHDFVTGIVSSIDKFYWVQDSEDNFAYAATPAGGTDDPEKVEFADYGDGVPNFSIRWVAFKGAENLQIPGDIGPKDFAFGTGGQTLFEVTFRPRNKEVLTENPNWFTTTQAILQDISTIDFTKGLPNSTEEGVDFGAGPVTNIGIIQNAFDGLFNEDDVDIWGVSLRDPVTNLPDADRDFPHFIYRVFRDPYRGDILTRNVKAVQIVGHNERYYPTTFSIQSLRTGRDPELDTSWRTVENGTFTSVDTFQEGIGYTIIFPDAIETTGIRLLITGSVYEDDEVLTELDSEGTDTFGTSLNVSGPQTRLRSLTIFEEAIEEATLQGTIESNQAHGATFTSSTATPGHPVTALRDEDIETFWHSTDFTDAVTITLPRKSTINRFEWEQDINIGNQSGRRRTGAPEDFTLSAIVGGVSTTLVQQTSFSGTLFTAELDPPPFSDTFTFDITAVQGQNEDASGIILSEVRLIEETTLTTPLIRFEEIATRRPGGINKVSTKAIYAASIDVFANVRLTGIDAGSDTLWSQRDFFVFWLDINDISLLDTTVGSIRLGNDSETFYRWDIKDLNLTNGFNKIKLQFKEAADISPIPFQSGGLFDANTGESQVDFLTPDVEITSASAGTGFTTYRIEQAPGIRFFEFEFRGTKGSGELELTFDDMRFERNRFDDIVKFEPSLYLNNSEMMSINLNGLDLATGTVEFWIQPDFDPGGVIRNDQVIVPSLFRIVRPDGNFMSLFYRPGTGFTVALFDGTQLLNFISNAELYSFNRFDTMHFALVWHADADILPFHASMLMYINGEVVYGTDKKWKLVREPGNRIFFGGEMSQRFVASPHNRVALTFTAVPSLPTNATASSWAAIENLKIYNYAKTDFSDRLQSDLTRTQLVPPSEMVQISLDGVDFESVGSANLPLVKKGVADEESVNLYVRTNIPKGLTGRENRDASLIVRWKTPLQECD